MTEPRDTSSNSGEGTGAYTLRRRLLILAAVSIVPAAFALNLLLAYTYFK